RRDRSQALCRADRCRSPRGDRPAPAGTARRRRLPRGRHASAHCYGERSATAQCGPGAADRMKTLAISVVLLLTFAGTAPAQQQPQAPKKAAENPAPAPAKPVTKPGFPAPAFKITIATEGASPPFNYLDRKGLPAGFEMELAQEACQRIKAECEF